MATARQIAANRENAKKSTGPVTPEGKASSCRNHFSHGFEASTSFIDGEAPEDFYGLMADLQREYEPVTTTEKILLEKMFHHQWLSLRAIRLQTRRLRTMNFNDEVPKDLGLLIRYQTAADRAFHKAHAELLRAQKERKMSEIGFEPKNSDKAAETCVESPQNELGVSERPVVQTIKPACEPNIIPASRKMAAVSGELPQAA